jgi:hypothetical protein
MRGRATCKKARQWRRAKSREKRRESRSDRKLRTFRPGGLWLFTVSAAATGDQLGAAQRKAPLGGERGYVSGHDQRGEGPDPRNQPPGRGVTVTDWRLHTADPRHIDGSGNHTAEWSGYLRHQPTMSPSALKGLVLYALAQRRGQPTSRQKRKTPLPGEKAGLVIGTCPSSEKGGSDSRNQPLGCGVTVTNWRLYTADHRHIDGGGNQNAE